MDPRGGRRAINALHGKAIAKNSVPLIVDISHDVSHVCVCLSVVCLCSLTVKAGVGGLGGRLCVNFIYC